MKEIRITGLQAGQRLDRFLEKYLSGASTGFLYRMLRKKNITLNGKKAQGHEKLKEADVIRIWFSEETLEKFTEGRAAAPCEIQKWPVRPLDILYEDADAVLVNKPAGMLSQRMNNTDVSLCEYLTGYLLAEGKLTPEDLATFRPSVCNRLDRGTSGIVCCGKTMRGLQQLSSAIADRRIGKYYGCVVLGEIKEEILLEGYLKKNAADNRSGISESEGAGDGARPVKTRVRPLGSSRLTLQGRTYTLTLAECELITGRSHQIRAHLFGIGHPLAGDPKYGDRDFNEQLKHSMGIRRQLLHCVRMEFPEDSFTLRLAGKTVTAPLPGDFSACLKEMGVPETSFFKTSTHQVP